MAAKIPAASTGLAITNPLILYRALVATRQITSDEAQHRLAIHLQKLYHRLKDYEPQREYRDQLEEIGVILNRSDEADASASPSPSGFLTRFRTQRPETKSMALTRRLTSHESALHIDSPRGLLIHGEVGTGKSMLVDLLADSLPSRKKRRYHFNTFMLETFARLERLRRQRLLLNRESSLAIEDAQSSSLLLIARDLIATSPILFLDEFQLPDRAASKILSNLFTSFFHLGGVLVATSNRMPEELDKASGVGFAPVSSQGGLSLVQEALFGRSGRGRPRSMFSSQSDFAAFLEVLQARCETWDMKSSKDWRRIEMENTPAESAPITDESIEAAQHDSLDALEELTPGNLGLGFEQSKDTSAPQAHSETDEPLTTPSHYHTYPVFEQGTDEANEEWRTIIRNVLSVEPGVSAFSDPTTWEPSTVRVYGRTVTILHAQNGICAWTFPELCMQSLGPADYITLASTYHTFIVSDVPVLSLLQKNEARRFITLLDALYEARCKLLIRAAAGPDELFFPESDARSTAEAQDTVYPETFSEIYQDATAPFRPNTSAYEPTASPPSYASSPLPQVDSLGNQAHRSNRSILADEDSDFGPTYGAGRSSGASTGYAESFHSVRGAGDGAPGAGHEIASTPDFQRTSTFTGEDERFAYKRARSRLWEMCGERWWSRMEEGWWRPLSLEVRHWERDAERPLGRYSGEPREEAEDGHTASPFRTSREPPPKISWVHAWGMVSWGKKAGPWGKGVDGLKERRTKDGGEEKEQ